MKNIQHIIEFIIARVFLAIFTLMPFALASNIGAACGKFIGPKLKVSNTARRNIKLAMPQLKDVEIEEIIIGMWDNLGRIITEFSQLHKNINEFIEISGQENLAALINGKGSFVMTGHVGNWEMLPLATYNNGLPLHIVYRRANNPYIDKMICNIRSKHQLVASAKGSVGARQMIKSLQDNRKLLMLVDQKQNDGIAVPFFGRNAMTAPGIASMSLKYNANIVPARVVRVNKTKFRLVVYPAIKIKKTGDDKADILAVMSDINAILEGWIEEYPQQWFWVHNRWPKVAV